MSREGVRKRRYCGVVATNSFVPTQAAICVIEASTPKRRCSQPWMARRNGSVPMDGG